ncbi:hypothetical protein KGM_202842 [Danaus plexippus plexippus]|uniref:Uncharacterized protein n=1 Tax=Danaus plexippus plexippus TaxID=278856 RepID=A0A212EWY7_DANPL|nr:hypothetical protein KGM_202842 [Danaus plexippus plexippus]
MDRKKQVVDQLLAPDGGDWLLLDALNSRALYLRTHSSKFATINRRVRIAIWSGVLFIIAVLLRTLYLKYVKETWNESDSSIMSTRRVRR